MSNYAFLAVVLPLSALALTAHGQAIGVQNQALLSSTVNAAALEPPARVSLAFSPYGLTGDWLGGVGVRVGLGSVYALVKRASRERALNVGYAQRVAAYQLPFWLGASVGADLTTGIRRWSDRDRTSNSFAARLSVPFALRWSTPTAVSAAIYAAPYGEAGRGPRYTRDCATPFECELQYLGPHATSAAGIGVGVRVTAWRFGLDVGVRDVLEDRYFGSDEMTALLTFRF